MNLNQLRERLNKEFYTDNLYAIARLCNDMALESDNPAPFFIMQNIFLRIANNWDDRPIEVGDAGLVKAEINKSLIPLVDAIEANQSNEYIIQLANKAIKSYLFLFP